jgi:hypothetical protein
MKIVLVSWMEVKMRTRRMTILFVMLLLNVLINKQGAEARDYYVAVTGSDSNPGTFAAPFRTINKGVSLTVAGDKVYVMNGTYNERVQMSRSGNAGAPITLAAYSGHSPKIQGPSNTEVINVAAGGGTSSVGWLIIEGFEIYQTSSNKSGSFGISLYNVHDAIIRRNIVHHTGIGIIGNGINVTIDRNIIYHNGGFEACATTPTMCSLDHGIYGSGGSNWKITNNLIYDNLAYGIQIAAYPYDSSKHTDASYAGASGWLVANNTIAYNNYRCGIVVWQGGATNGIFQNNIFYENSAKTDAGGTQGIYFLNSGRGHVVQNNVFYATTPGGTAWITDTGASYTASGNLTTSDPKFNNAGPNLPASPNFQVLSGSPVIDGGLTLLHVPHDFRGVARPSGSAHDIGAYEGDTTLANAPAPPKGLRVN